MNETFRVRPLPGRRARSRIRNSRGRRASLAGGLALLLSLGGCGTSGSFIAPVVQKQVPSSASATAQTATGAQIPASTARAAAGAARAVALPSSGGGQIRALGPPRSSGLQPLAPPPPGATASAAKAALEPPANLEPAVRVLVEQANAKAQTGDGDGAAALLERALQLNPNQPWLWYRLAREREAQGRYALSESLAAKSNALATGDPHLQELNWRLIAQARGERGDRQGAIAAYQQANRLTSP